MTLSLEQDVVRGLLGGWRTREAESGALARDLCVAMARIHLLAGKDVVVPQFVANPDYLDRLAEVAAQAGAQHIEFVLLDDLSSAERRFHARINDPSGSSINAQLRPSSSRQADTRTNMRAWLAA
jgi:hypothetical protein